MGKPFKGARCLALFACLAIPNAFAVVDLSCSGPAQYNGEDVGPYEYRIQIVKSPDEQSKATMYIWGVFAGGEDEPLGWLTENSEINGGEETYYPSNYPRYIHKSIKDDRILKLLEVDRYDLSFEYGVTSYDIKTAEPSFWFVEGKCSPYVERKFKI